jgi:hypothetical protein
MNDTDNLGNTGNIDNAKKFLNDFFNPNKTDQQITDDILTNITNFTWANVYDLMKMATEKNNSHYLQIIFDQILPLIQTDIPENVDGNEDRTILGLLMTAVDKGYIDAIETFFNNGIIPKTQIQKNKMLSVAIISNNIYLAEILISLGADTSTIDNNTLVKCGLKSIESITDYFIQYTSEPCVISSEPIDIGEEYYLCNNTTKVKHVISKTQYDKWNNNCPYCKTSVDKSKIYINCVESI